MTKVDLTAIEGIEETTALVLLSEIGTDMSKWPGSKQFCSWLGLCPQGQAVGGQGAVVQGEGGSQPGGAGVTAGGMEHVAVRARRRWVHSSGGSRAESGRAKAVTATAHNRWRGWCTCRLLKHGQAYVAKGLEEYEQQHHERQLRSLKRKSRKTSATS